MAVVVVVERVAVVSMAMTSAAVAEDRPALTVSEPAMLDPTRLDPAATAAGGEMLRDTAIVSAARSAALSTEAAENIPVCLLLSRTSDNTPLTTIVQPPCKATCISRHPQIRNIGF